MLLFSSFFSVIFSSYFFWWKNPIFLADLCAGHPDICVGKITIIVSDNGLSPERRQAIIWTNAGILFIETWGINFSEILSEIHTFSFKKIHLQMSSGKWRPSCLGLNVLTHGGLMTHIRSVNWEISFIIISIFRLGCCPCPIQRGWQHQATANTGSPSLSVLWVNPS